MTSGPYKGPRTAEQVRAGHPDKLCDQVGDAILDALLGLDDKAIPEAPFSVGRRFHRAGLEVLAKDDTVVISGEVRVPGGAADSLDYDGIVRQVYASAGYVNADRLRILNLVGVQQPELQASSDRRGAGDQGVMVGYATSATEDGLPAEFSYATDICTTLDDAMRTPEFAWLRPDGKAQVTIDAAGRVRRIVVGAQHASEINGITDPDEIQGFARDAVVAQILRPIFGDAMADSTVIVNGTGSFAIGGPAGDAGALGRKLVCDAYGPHVPVGGGAFSGKDPTKVDRSGAYMARHIARTVVAEEVSGAKSATVWLAYAIGSTQPEMVYGVTDSGRDISRWIRSRFPDLVPAALAERFDLWKQGPSSWNYRETARYGHFRRTVFPWNVPA
jgi:S-adenosylmethionine synthetase